MQNFARLADCPCDMLCIARLLIAGKGGKKNEVKMAERDAVQDMDIVATEC